MRSYALVTALFAIALVSGARAADQLPDRRAVHPIAVTGAAAPAGNEAMLELLNDIEDLKTQVRQMRGQLEVQDHQLEQLRNSQRQSLIDLDRRLRQLEQRPSGSTSSVPGGQAPASALAAPGTGGGVAAPARAPSASEQQQYDAAFNLMKQGLYQQAAARFRDFIARNPKSALADNAQYWVGEAAYVTRDFRTALDAFGKVLSNYPQSPKVPDAMLKIGYCHYELAAYDRARATLNQVVARYPNTLVAKSAELRLQKMAKEGD